MTTAWNRISEIAPPIGVEVDTKIDDTNGERNIQPMTLMRDRQHHRDDPARGLWWINLGKPGAMYVYYTPTHWRPLSSPEAARRELE